MITKRRFLLRKSSGHQKHYVPFCFLDFAKARGHQHTRGIEHRRVGGVSIYKLLILQSYTLYMIFFTKLHFFFVTSRLRVVEWRLAQPSKSQISYVA